MLSAFISKTVQSVKSITACTLPFSHTAQVSWLSPPANWSDRTATQSPDPGANCRNQAGTPFASCLCYLREASAHLYPRGITGSCLQGYEQTGTVKHQDPWAGEGWLGRSSGWMKHMTAVQCDSSSDVCVLMGPGSHYTQRREGQSCSSWGAAAAWPQKNKPIGMTAPARATEVPLKPGMLKQL